MKTLRKALFTLFSVPVVNVFLDDTRSVRMGTGQINRVVRQFDHWNSTFHQNQSILAFRSRNRTLNDGYIYYLAGTDKTKFKRSVVPGDQLRLEVEIINLRKHWMKASGKAYVDDNLVCSSMLTCAEQQVG